MAASQRRHSSLLTVAGARAGAAVAKSPRSSRAAPNWSSSVALAPTPYPTPTAPMRPSPQRGAVRLGPSAALPLANEIANLSVPPPPTPKPSLSPAPLMLFYFRPPAPSPAPTFLVLSHPLFHLPTPAHPPSVFKSSPPRRKTSFSSPPHHSPLLPLSSPFPGNPLHPPHGPRSPSSLPLRRGTPPANAVRPRSSDSEPAACTFSNLT